MRWEVVDLLRNRRHIFQSGERGVWDNVSENECPFAPNPDCSPLKIISWRHKGQNAYLALPWANRSRAPGSHSVGRKIHSGGSIGNRLEKEPQSPLFPASIGKTGKLSRRPLVRTDAADMLKRRLKQAGLPAHYSPHSFRATGITNFLENDGTLEAAQRIAGHADSRTTKLYDRRGQKVLLEDMESIRY